MHYIADLHIHSYYSRATSKKLNLEHLNLWAQLKGLQVVATGDITHPKWLQEMEEKLEPAQQGLFKLKDEFSRELQSEVPGACNAKVYFILSGEISSIYKKNDRVRKVHNVVFMPSFEAVEKFQATLDRIGNIHSDGRPILGLDSRDLLEIVLETDPRGQLIPAHIWTPWFSMLGSKSGFDTVEECFDDLTPHIFAVETGLSSDPPMNWRLSMLDKYALVSNSDAHSPAKLAREANVFDVDLSYDALFASLKDKEGDSFWGTIEFFPEEGKYHMDGHRACKRMMKPGETMKHNGLCPVCGKPATLGVSYRVEELADRPEGGKPGDAKPFMSLIPLPEVISEVVSVGPSSKRVQKIYDMMLQKLGSELYILMDAPLKDIEESSGSLVAEAIRRMRKGHVHPQPGYDGEYGVIRIFKNDEREKILQQGTLFALSETVQIEKDETDKNRPHLSEPSAKVKAVRDETNEYGLNAEQRQAVDFHGAPLIVQAGPGTGKTRTLTHRLAALVRSSMAKPEEILAVTFTNKAAGEMRVRLNELLSAKESGRMHIQTFHAFGAEFLREQKSFFGRRRDFTIINPLQDTSFLILLEKKARERVPKSVLDNISLFKGKLVPADAIPKEIEENLPRNFPAFYKLYEELLSELNAVDYDDLINLPLRILRNDPQTRRTILRRYPVIAVDEFQDINRAQYELFKILAIAARDVCVIGDPDQAIYGFRGASRDFFLQFGKDFPHAKSIRLRRNYRSARNILSASTQMLSGGEGFSQDDLWSDIAPDVKIHIQQSVTDRAEAEFVVHRIEQLLGGTSYFSIDSKRVDDRGLPQDYTFSDIAVLLRTKRLLPPLEEALARSGIPFESFADETLLSYPIVQFVAAGLRLADGSFAKNDIFRIAEFLLVHDPKEKENLEKILGSWDGESLKDFMGKSRDMSRFFEYVEDLRKAPQELSVVENIKRIRKKLKLDGTVEKDTNILFQRLMRMAQPFGNRRDKYLDALALQRESDDFDIRADRVHILTLHASKGLEFPVVFIVGCEEDILPLRLGRSSDVDEERRLLYVGMTRAQSQLYLTHAKSRLIFGQKHLQTPSRFLAAISAHLVQRQKAIKAFKRKDADQLNLNF